MTITDKRDDNHNDRYPEDGDKEQTRGMTIIMTVIHRMVIKTVIYRMVMTYKRDDSCSDSYSSSSDYS